MEVDETAFELGLELGSRRTTELFLLPASRERSAALYDVLRSWPGDGNAHFVSLITEIWVVADVARAFNREPALTRDELLSFLATMYWVTNSFKHR